MLKNYIKTAFKNLFRHKSYSFLNIFGLAIGLTGFFMVVLFVQKETGYDRFHEKAERIYRIATEFIKGGHSDHWATTNHQLAPLLKSSFAGIEQVVTVAEKNALSN